MRDKDINIQANRYLPDNNSLQQLKVLRSRVPTNHSVFVECHQVQLDIIYYREFSEFIYSLFNTQIIFLWRASSCSGTFWQSDMYYSLFYSLLYYWYNWELVPWSPQMYFQHPVQGIIQTKDEDVCRDEMNGKYWIQIRSNLSYKYQSDRPVQLANKVCSPSILCCRFDL